MARLRHETTGAVVSVTDEKAERMGSEWVPFVDAPAKKTAAKKTTAARKTSDN